MEKHSLAESIITAVVFIVVFGGMSWSSEQEHQPALAAQASGFALSMGSVSLVVQLGEIRP